MSAFVIMNVPTAAGMLQAKTPMQNLFWQWANQSYNVVNNYVNRAGPSATTPRAPPIGQSSTVLRIRTARPNLFVA